MNALAGLRTPADAGRAEFRLRTLTPLYTGGIGQQGEHIHPSNLLGGVRRFSCLLAAAIGDAGFEAAVWGRAGDARSDPSAKGVACIWDLSALRESRLKPTVNWPRADNQNRPGGWRFNVAHAGALTLGLTRRAISDAHWQLLLLALRIQIRHATFGAKDQHGLGVLGCDEWPEVEPLVRVAGRPLTDRPGLDRAFFAELQFDAPPPTLDADYGQAIEDGLRLRELLRSLFRVDLPDKPTDVEKRQAAAETDLRHYLFGHLAPKQSESWGSAINVSALYRRADGNAGLRVWGLMPHTCINRDRHANDRPSDNQLAKALNRIHACLQQALPFAHMKARPCHLAVWEDGRVHAAGLVAWINHLAGV